MNIERYDTIMHHKEMSNLILSRDMKPEEVMKHFPHYGFVAIKRKKIIAAAFLRMCEGKIGIFDGLISNPKYNSETRHKAITGVVNAVLKQADDMEFKKIICWTNDKCTIKRALENQFKKTDFDLLVRSI